MQCRCKLGNRRLANAGAGFLGRDDLPPEIRGALLELLNVHGHDS